MYYKEKDENVRYENGEDMTKKENLEEYKKYFKEKKKKQNFWMIYKCIKVRTNSLQNLILKEENG